jgi:hypothetical protein
MITLRRTHQAGKLKRQSLTSKSSDSEVRLVSANLTWNPVSQSCVCPTCSRGSVVEERLALLKCMFPGLDKPPGSCSQTRAASASLEAL